MENTLNGWLRAIDEEMVCTHLGIADASDSYEVAKEKLNKLIAWHVAVATDPAVNGGYVMVPEEPTLAMEKAGIEVLPDAPDVAHWWIHFPKNCYRAMLSTTQKPKDI